MLDNKKLKYNIQKFEHMQFRINNIRSRIKEYNELLGKYIIKIKDNHKREEEKINKLQK